MRGFIKFLFVISLCFAAGTMVSYFAFFSFYFAPRVFHSASTVRACDEIGQVVLLPVRILFRCFGGFVDQSLPFSHPLNYVTTNGIFLGTLIYAGIRPILFRHEPPGGAGEKKTP